MPCSRMRPLCITSPLLYAWRQRLYVTRAKAAKWQKGPGLVQFRIQSGRAASLLRPYCYGPLDGFRPPVYDVGYDVRKEIYAAW